MLAVTTAMRGVTGFISLTMLDRAVTQLLGRLDFFFFFIVTVVVAPTLSAMLRASLACRARGDVGVVFSRPVREFSLIRPSRRAGQLAMSRRHSSEAQVWFVNDIKASVSVGVVARACSVFSFLAVVRVSIGNKSARFRMSPMLTLSQFVASSGTP